MPDYVPALKGKMGDWTYYVTVMKMGKIADTCRFADEIHPNRELDALLQREIGKRAEDEIVPYLLKEDQRFFGSLVVAVYGGNPEFSPVNVAEHELLNDNEQSSYGFGLLRFDGGQIYYALDGQHRLSAIKKATSDKIEMRNEEVSVIIIKHENNSDGLERTRRLFSNLNRHAKPTSAGMNIALSEDDSIAIVTRRLVKENDIFKRLVLSNAQSLNSKQLNPTNRKNDAYITTLSAFYECNEILLKGYDGGLNIDSKFKQFRKPYEELDRYYKFLESIWVHLLKTCPNFDRVINETRTPGELRIKRGDNGVPVLDNKNKPVSGGSIFARPMGQYVICEVLQNALVQGRDVFQTIDAIMTNVSMDVDERPWAGVVWNSSAHVIKGTNGDRKLLANIISYALGLKTLSKHQEILQKYRNTVENEKATFPVKRIEWIGSVEETNEEYTPETPETLGMFESNAE
jgi:DNA sulfur modification protein DndB